MSTYIERDATRVTFPAGYPPKVVNRFNKGSAGRNTATSINFEKIVTEVPNSGSGWETDIVIEYMSDSDVETLRTLASGVGVLTVVLTPDESTQYYGAFNGSIRVEPLDGPYPENAPDMYRYSKVTIPLVLWT